MYSLNQVKMLASCGRDPARSLPLWRGFLLIPLILVCFAFAPQMHAQLSPPPDGCYGDNTLFNTAEGCDALFLNTTGTGNAGIGWRSLYSDSTGNFNTGCGGGVLALNNADSNTGVGAAALLLNDSGTRNTAVGTDALVFNGFLVDDDGSFNGAFGAFSLFNNLDGFSNNAVGDSALFANVLGALNTAVGDQALENNDSSGAGIANFNTAVGAQALFSNVDGDSNNAVGFNALGANTTGLFNQAIGVNALSSNTTGSSNIAIGDTAGMNVTTANNVICIGDFVAGENVSNSCYVGSIFGQTSSGGAAVFVNSAGKLGTSTSSRRFKEEIKPMEQASEALFSLKPVTFRYKKEIDSAGTSQFGLLAEDVEKINPDLVVRDNEERPYSVRYDQVNAMLLNEFLKAHRKMEEQGATIARQQKQIEALTAGLEKVSDQLELNKSAPQTVLNNQ